MKVFGRGLLFLLCACVFCSTTAGYAEQGDVDMSYRTEEIWCENGSSRIYGVACIPETEGRLPLVIFSHELGNNHEAGVRYAECLAAHGYAAYVFDFCGGSAGGTSYVTMPGHHPPEGIDHMTAYKSVYREFRRAHSEIILSLKQFSTINP